MGLAEKLDELGAELNAFAFQPRTLVSDLVLFALATDVFESAKAVRHTSESTLPHKAYSNARLAFEGAQQALVLARTKTTRLRARSRGFISNRKTRVGVRRSRGSRMRP